VLKKYLEKRDLKKSREPDEKVKKTAKGPLNFCIQKHAARRLHYDLRLEYKGVLVSFAIPKGPPKENGEKHLAIHVEDHPLEYQYFEGTIPEGNYGAGTVKIWDKGIYATETDLGAGLKKGHFTAVFMGKKVKGGFSFVRMKENEWLMIKKDE